MNETDFGDREDELKDVIQNKAKVVQQSMQAIELAKGAQAEIDRIKSEMQSKLDMEKGRSLELEKTLEQSNKKLWKVTDEYTRLAGKVEAGEDERQLQMKVESEKAKLAARTLEREKSELEEEMNKVRAELNRTKTELEGALDVFNAAADAASRRIIDELEEKNQFLNVELENSE